MQKELERVILIYLKLKVNELATWKQALAQNYDIAIISNPSASSRNNKKSYKKCKRYIY